MTHDKFKKGFTLIELLVVVAIISVLASVVLTTVNTARDRAKYARAKIEIDQLRKAMTSYKLDNRELPPVGDLCSSCTNPPNATWTQVIDALVTGGYMGSRADRDPWGNYYGYDDNDCNSNPGASYLFTAGRDLVSLTSDDYTVLVTSSCAD